jgi:hypothetical protein
MAKKFKVKQAPREFTLNEPITFGKCKGALLVVVIEDDPKYVRWCLDNIDWFRIDKEAELKLMMEEEYKPSSGGWGYHDGRDDMCGYFCYDEPF